MEKENGSLNNFGLNYVWVIIGVGTQRIDPRDFITESRNGYIKYYWISIID